MKVTRRENQWGETAITVSMDEIPGPVAELAFKMLDRWGPVVAAPDGVDEAGRQKMRRLTALETVEEAFDIAQQAFRVAENRGLMIRVEEADKE